MSADSYIDLMYKYHALKAEFDRRGAELDRIRRVRCLGHVYSGLQPPEQCGDYAGHEGKCQP